jgi:hypothetical protein
MSVHAKSIFARNLSQTSFSQNIFENKEKSEKVIKKGFLFQKI